MSPTSPFVVVGGNIATGKSTLVRALGSALSVKTFPERWQSNPWFGGSQAEAFASQLWFLLSAAADSARIGDHGGIQERCIHENALVFGPELLDSGSAATLRDVYTALDRILRPPDLFVFLWATPRALASRIRDRGRPQESKVDIKLLTRLDERYRVFIENWTLCPVVRIDTESYDLRIAGKVTDVIRLVLEGLT